MSVLKKRGWSSELSAGSKFEARGIELFDVNVDLTEDGVNHVDDIIKLIFQVTFLPIKAHPTKEYGYYEYNFFFFMKLSM